MRSSSLLNFRTGIWVVILIAVSAMPGAADIYKYVDSRGVIHFTNAPTSAGYQLYIKERPRVPAGGKETDQFDSFISEASKTHGISFPLLKAVIKVESDYNPRAVSKKGAQGLMQIMPETGRALNVGNVFDPLENIMAGSRYLKQLLQRFEGKLSLALAAYNAGPRAVVQYQGIPPIPETEAYVQKVLNYYYRFKKDRRL